MRTKLTVLLLLICVLYGTAQQQGNEMSNSNPFYKEFDTPFGTPPFDKIKNEHFMPAFKQGMEVQQQEVHTIINDTLPPTFQNTIEVLDRTGDMLGRVSAVFFSLQGANTNDDIQKIANDVTP
ncbi:MAG TPA: peptidase M3, partial [Bacteroidetes bacterium]|nr:peptidase M3 [Bacteroidota bacterium]